MMQTLVQNATYITNDGDQTKEPSACERQCRVEQQELISCMNSIRDYNESIAASSSPLSSTTTTTTTNGEVNKCLVPSIATWTQCCTKANNQSQLSNNDDNSNK